MGDDLEREVSRSEFLRRTGALGVAGAAGAQKYAPEVFAKAQQELAQAQQIGRPELLRSRRPRTSSPRAAA